MPSSRSDPVESRADDDRDLYDIATWEERTSLDGLSVALHWLITRSAKAIVVFVALLGLLAILGSFGLGLVFDPAVGMLVGLSAIPARARSVRVRLRRDHRRAALPAGGDVPPVDPDRDVRGTPQQRRAAVLPPFGFPGLVLFFFAIVGPIEESVKLLAVRLYAYTDDRFDAVIDGAVYGAIAGLGFVVIENLVYIAQTVDLGSFRSVSPRSVRATGSPRCARARRPRTRHLLRVRGILPRARQIQPWEPGTDRREGLIIAAAIHALYNTLVGPVTTVLSVATGLPQLVSPVRLRAPVSGRIRVVLLEAPPIPRRVPRDARRGRSGCQARNDRVRGLTATRSLADPPIRLPADSKITSVAGRPAIGRPCRP